MSTVGKISYMNPLEQITGDEWIEVMVGSGNKADNLKVQLKDVFGIDGKDGNTGLSTYELAVSIGFTGTLEEWLLSLVGARGAPGDPGQKGDPGPKGDNGDDAYTQAQQEGFVGTVGEWLESLRGAPGINGKSPYQIAVEEGFTGTVQEWLASLKGTPGVSVDHLKLLSTSNPEGVAGVLDHSDTYRFYGDPEETIVIGDFTINNGQSTQELAGAVIDDEQTGTETTWSSEKISQAVSGGGLTEDDVKAMLSQDFTEVSRETNRVNIPDANGNPTDVNVDEIQKVTFSNESGVEINLIFNN